MADLSGYRFTKTHEWVRDDGSGEALVGITDNAQSQLGDVIFLDLPKVGATLGAGARFGAVESVKAASDLFSPVGGEVVAVNTDVTVSPELVNQDPYGRGWLLRLRVDGDPPADLLDSAEYDSFAEADSH
ncbi:MAG TPA: glycine cleavage system protein GcvH [Candidatus Saccharimonadales bacterium]|nr:glycine cleavage system protein GcvH [Candidatus Saccharimonadales bacterium]